MEPALKKRIRRFQAKMLQKNANASFSEAARTLLKRALDAEGIR